MDIGALSIIMSQSKVQEIASIAVMKIGMETDKENASQMKEMINNISVDSNTGQNLYVRA